uniref:Uncharacterized protein n=1 Tax=Utricularia reniformis TaxID=192314 RepID=A0A1Y0B4G6_9LAMI|nr:hypothetical protein AEK19_MT2133 [Utricularia reniformis]ART32283.1 hypothetical protein AEK19_MT2133 [Utricularia reniformis]
MFVSLSCNSLGMINLSSREINQSILQTGCRNI